MARIAYIFFGQVKNFDEKQYSAFSVNVRDKLRDFDVDYFLVTSKQNNYLNPRQKNFEGSNIDYQSIEKYFDFKEKYYDQESRSKNEKIEELAVEIRSFGEAWKEGNSLVSIKNSLKQLYCLEYFYNKIESCIDEYDYFILSRSDLYHTHPLNTDCFSRDEELFAPYYYICPQIDYGWFGGINDRFAVVKSKRALNTYCTRYSRLKQKQEYYHAEQYLLKQLQKDNIKYGKIHNFMFLLERSSGELSDFIGIEKDEKMNTKLKAISKSYFINLDRRIDRLNHICVNLPFFAERFSAVDANQVELNDEVKKLFPKTWQKRTKAEICCAISHYRLWQKLTMDRDAKNYLILEDDTVFKPGFTKFWNQIYSEHMPKGAFLIYLGGCQPWNKSEYHKVLRKQNDYFYTVKRNDYFTKDDHFWHMNANSYILSKQGASLLCQWVEQFGMDQAVDNFMQNFFNENKLFAAPELVFHLNPLMSYQLHEENDNVEKDRKSDLRFAEEKFSINEQKKNLIPKTIFQTWETCDVEGFLKYLTERIQSYNPEYQYEFFDSERRRNFIENNFDKKVLDCYDRIIPGAFKADLWRYCVLYKQGGIYCDIDMLMIASFDYFILDGVDFFAPIDFARKHRSSMLTNGMFGCVAGSEIMKNCIDIIVDNIQNNAWIASKTEDIIFDYLNFTGPGVLGRALNMFLDRDEYSSFDKNYGIIEYKGKKIKLLEFSRGDEYIKDLNGRRVIQNKNGNAKVKKEVDAQIKNWGIKHWGEQLGLSRKPYQDDVSTINPSAVEHEGIKYVLYRTEIYPQDCPAYYKSSSGKRINFYRSDAGYQLQVGSNKKIDCDFVFDEYSYRTSRMIDLAGTNKLKIEDVRFIENTVELKDGELSCLACCTILSNIDVFEGKKKGNGSWDEKKPMGLRLKTSPGICRVNLSAGKIQYIRTLSGELDDIQKNWLMFKHDGLYYCLYSMFPLLYCAHESIEQIQFSQQEKSVSPEIHNATCPVQIDDNTYAMICHSERQSIEKKPGSLSWAYKKYFVSFDLVNGEIANVCLRELGDIRPEYYCSSILKDGDQLKVFAGVEDIDCVEFNIDIPQLKKIKTKNKLIFTQNNLFEQDFICEMFEDFDVVINEDMNIVEENSVIVYSDMYAKNINIYPEKFRENLNQLRAKQKEYFEKLKNKNCILVHLSDEHCHAEIDHYKNFKHVFRQYYRKDAVADNVTFIPLGYKKGFKT